MSDEELIRASQQGDEHATEMLLKSYEGYVRCLSRDWFVPGHEYEDVRQECRLGFLTAIQTWKAERDTPLRQWARIVIRRRIINLVRAQQRTVDSISLQEWDVPLNELGYEDAEVRCLWHRVCATCTRLECEAVLGYVRGQSYSDVARRLGVSCKTVDNALCRVREKFKRQRGDWV